MWWVLIKMAVFHQDEYTLNEIVKTAFQTILSSCYQRLQYMHKIESLPRNSDFNCTGRINKRK